MDTAGVVSVSDRAVGQRPPARLSLFHACVAGALFAAAVPAPILAAPQSPVAAEIKSSGRLNRDLKAFYKARDYRPLWIRHGTIGPGAARLGNLIGSHRSDETAHAPEEGRGGEEGGRLGEA